MNPRVTGLILVALGAFAAVALHRLRPQDGGAARHEGALLFESVCANCHGARGEGNFEFKSPSIAALPDWYVAAQIRKFRADVRGASPEDLAGAQMRANAHTLSDRAVTEVASHVASLPRHPTKNTLGGLAARGKESYKLHCEACHLPDAGGDSHFKSAPLTGLQDWYLASQLEKFRTRVRGGHPRDIEGAKMAEPSERFLSPQDEKDVLAYIAQLAGAR